MYISFLRWNLIQCIIIYVNSPLSICFMLQLHSTGDILPNYSMFESVSYMENNSDIKTHWCELLMSWYECELWVQFSHLNDM